MLDFFHDPTRNLLIYKPPSPFHIDGILKHIPEAKQLNGAYVAVPRTLRNSQVMRWLNYAVMPIMDNYDWPIGPGRTVLPHQKAYANFQVLHPRCFNLGDPGCVAGSTLLETDAGRVRIDELTRRGKAIKVRALTPDGVQLVPAECPFRKGVEKLYRVTFKSGRTIEVTAKHFFLTCRGWVSCADLVVGEQLPKFDDALLASNSEFALSKLLRDAHRSIHTTPNSLGCCGTLFCDAPLLQEEDSALVSVPSRGDFQEHTSLSSQKGGQGTRYIHSALPAFDRLSTQRYGSLRDRRDMEFLACESTTKPVEYQDRTFEQYRQRLTPQQLAHADSELRTDSFHCLERTEFCFASRGNERSDKEHRIFLRPEKSTSPEQSGLGSFPHEACCAEPWAAPPVDTVANIAYVKTDVYYDIHVPVHENYIAHGVCNHNTMKTLSSLWAADWLMRQWPEGTFRCLVICPLTIIETGWAAEVFKNFLNRRSVEILHGDEDKRKRLLAKKADFSLINFDGVGVGAHTRKKFELDGFSKELAQRDDIKLVIVDEARGYGDAQTKRSRIARLVIGNKPYMWELCGSPTPQAPTDCYGMAKLLNGAFGKSFKTFQSETMVQISPYKWVPRKDGYDQARRLLSPSIRFTLDEIWDGPEQTIQQSQVELSDEQKSLLATLKRDLSIIVKSGKVITPANEGAARLKLLQISAGAVYDSDHRGHPVDNGPRLTELKRIIDSTQRKVVVFVGFTAVIDLLAKVLTEDWRKKNLTRRLGIVNGDVTGKRRTELLLAFQSDPEFKVMLADPTTTAHGVNEFVAADTAVWFGPCDKTDLWIQGNARIRRPGQKYPSTIFQIVSNQTEKEIFRRLETNTGMQGLMLEMVRKGEL